MNAKRICLINVTLSAALVNNNYILFFRETNKQTKTVKYNSHNWKSAKRGADHKDDKCARVCISFCGNTLNGVPHSITTTTTTKKKQQTTFTIPSWSVAAAAAVIQLIVRTHNEPKNGNEFGYQKTNNNKSKRKFILFTHWPHSLNSSCQHWAAVFQVIQFPSEYTGKLN